jgi:hypothetical protein
MNTTADGIFNHIMVKWTDTHATLVTYIDNNPIAWTEYDAMQLDKLITLLQRARRDITKVVSEGDK